jgi:putative transcriptional regulator
MFYIRNMNQIKKGMLLIAEPFMKDPNFQRSVVLLCEHQYSGTFGITVNKQMNKVVGDYIEELSFCDLPIHDGGPVSRDHIHFLHQYPDLISGGQEIADGIYWGGEFSELVSLLKTEGQKKIRFYLGYSGWGENQLESEMKEKSWLILPATRALVLSTSTDQIWKEAVKSLGDEYRPIINYPLDPSYN